MSNHDRNITPRDASSSARDTPSDEAANVGKSRAQHNRDSGQLGADAPDYGQPKGQRPEPEPTTGPNRNGPQYEEGGRYPGTRNTTETTESRSEDPGQSSYGGFKNEDPSYQRQEVPKDSKP